MLSGALQDPADFEPATERLNFLFATLVLPTIAVLAGQLSALRISQRRHKREQQQAVQRRHEMATHDELTGLVNRRHVQDWIGCEMARGQRTGGQLCLALIDLDHCKRINDSLGHAGGDQVLRIFSAGLTAMAPGQSLESALQKADLKLYQAKARGRDRFAIDTEAGRFAPPTAPLDLQAAASPSFSVCP